MFRCYYTRFFGRGLFFFFFSSRRRHTRSTRDWSSDVCSSDLSRTGLNSRHKIMRHYNGLQIMRERRQIDTIPPDFTKFQTYDANIKIEIDFDRSEERRVGKECRSRWWRYH